MKYQALLFALLLVLCGLPPLLAGETFTDVAKDSGVDEVIDSHYKAFPKWWFSGADLVDLDGDGHLDLFLGAHGGQAAVALSDGKGRFHYVDPGSTQYPKSEIHIAYDINEDGKLDLQCTHNDGGGLWYLNESKPGALSFKPTKVEAAGGQARGNAMIDINRDGKVDWLHENPRDGQIFELGDGKGGFSKGGAVPSWKENHAIPVDLNGDGFIDLVVTVRGYIEEGKGRSRIMPNDGKGGFTDATKESGLFEEAMMIQGVGDVNGDGAPDLLCLENGKELTVYLNDGKGKFTKLPNAVSGMEGASHPHYANWGLAVVVDLDNDGIPDALVNGRNWLWVLHGLGGGRFEYMNKKWGIKDTSPAAVDEGLCFGDVNEDGMLDIIGFTGADDKKRLAVYRNDLPKQNYLRIRPIGIPGNKGAAGAKIRVMEAGSQKLVGFEQVVIAGRQCAHSYYAFTQTERHFGLGGRGSVDVSVEFYPSGKKVEKKGVKANATIEIAE